ncbi:STAS domain-containing protein [Neisseria zoodegmatis]|uniref:NTP binding protein n=1 Tax=Neisseria zoodegmatis TaxID=326523 RepID=A0AB38DPH3_9NEIS|nr:STAS domain-containing protein [Neisseria zoodegmatis]OSI10452.1 sulfate transporter [Neisseria zoodegmatis]SNU79151.1 NTP binding protein [Neisseria zoodegmatis]
MQSEVRDGVLYVKGEVTVKTITPANYARFEQQCRLNETHTVDLSEVSRADSSCVSLLLTALRLKPSSVALRGLPDSVAALAELYEIKEWVAP